MKTLVLLGTLAASALAGWFTWEMFRACWPAASVCGAFIGWVGKTVADDLSTVRLVHREDRVSPETRRRLNAV
jgi:hypothetical protein